jgi:hypothetical protein
MRAETFALFFGFAYLSAGLLGLHPAALMPPPADAPPMQFTVLYGYLLGLFPVNLLHSAIHLAVGAWGIMAWRRVVNPRVFARVLAILYGALAVMGLIPGLNTLFGLLPLHGHDVWLHAGTAVVAAYFTWRPELSVEHRASDTPDRREEIQPVASERRLGHADRRLPSAGQDLL